MLQLTGLGMDLTWRVCGPKAKGAKEENMLGHDLVQRWKEEEMEMAESMAFLTSSAACAGSR